MPEDTGQPTPAETSPAITPAPEAKFVNSDGTLVEGWQGRLTDETLRSDETLKKFAAQEGITFEKLANTLVNLRKQVPMDKVVMPTETSPPEAWEDLYTRLGRPTTPEDYAVEIPEGLENYYADPMMTEAKTELHKVGLSQKQVDVVMALDRKRLGASIKNETEATEKAKTDAETALRNKWGTAYDERLHLANRMINDNVTDAGQKEAILARVGNDPVVGDFLANIAAKFVEHKIITDIETPSADLEGKIKQLMASPAYLGKDSKYSTGAGRIEHKEVVAEVYRLRQELVKMRPTGVAV